MFDKRKYLKEYYKKHKEKLLKYSKEKYFTFNIKKICKYCGNLYKTNSQNIKRIEYLKEGYCSNNCRKKDLEKVNFKICSI